MRKFIVVLIVISLSLPGAAQVDSAKYVLIEDTSAIHTIEDALKLPYFKGKVVYVDVWGTRCGPCIEEFKNMQALKARYRDKQVIFLYLKSPYGFDDSKEWKQMIYQYRLEGIHIAMSQRFYSDNFWQRYKEKYTEERSYGIPTYLIIDRKGAIVDYDAPRPHNSDALHGLIDKALAK
jgi:thiol-disulfide isomerase/thioredoxin